VVLSDYAKGVLTPRVIRTLIEAARDLGKPVIVDPKGKDFSIYRGATLITPNRLELAEGPPPCGRDRCRDRFRRCRAQPDRRERGRAGDPSEEGMNACPGRRTADSRAGASGQGRDVSGAGESVVAVLAAMLATEREFEPAVRAANAAAAVVVGKRGTATLSIAELRSRLLPASSLAARKGHIRLVGP